MSGFLHALLCSPRTKGCFFMQLHLLEHQRVHEFLIQPLGHFVGVVEDDLLKLNLRFGRSDGAASALSIFRVIHRPSHPLSLQALVRLVPIRPSFVRASCHFLAPPFAQEVHGFLIGVRAVAAVVPNAFTPRTASRHLMCRHRRRLAPSLILA